MKQVNIYEAKTQLSRLVDEVEGGEEVVIARAGKPVAHIRARTTHALSNKYDSTTLNADRA